MFCPNCGTNVEDGARFCPNCSAALTEEAPVQESAPVYEAQPVTPAAPAVNTSNILVFGILGLAFAESGILGIIFSAIALSKAKAYAAAYGNLTGKAKVGKILATVGLIVSILMVVFWVIYIIVIAAIAGAASGIGSGYYY